MTEAHASLVPGRGRLSGRQPRRECDSRILVEASSQASVGPRLRGGAANGIDDAARRRRRVTGQQRERERRLRCSWRSRRGSLHSTSGMLMASSYLTKARILFSSCAYLATLCAGKTLPTLANTARLASSSALSISR